MASEKKVQIRYPTLLPLVFPLVRKLELNLRGLLIASDWLSMALSAKYLHQSDACLLHQRPESAVVKGAP
jgi:hypothetical protein